jgi:RHS repeat-associated protein
MSCLKLHIIEDHLLLKGSSSKLWKRSSQGEIKWNYRFSFQGQEKDDEISGTGNSYTAEFWQYDPRLGRRWNVDPVDKPWMSPYHAFSNNPILNIDPNGANDDDIHYNSETGETTIIETDENKDNVLIDGRFITSVEQGSGKSAFDDARVIGLGNEWEQSYILQNEKIIGLDAIKYNGTDESTHYLLIDRGVVNLSGDGVFGFSQSVFSDSKVIDGPQGYQIKRLEGNDQYFSDNNREGYYRGTSYHSPDPYSFPFDAIMRDSPSRPSVEETFWKGENSIIWTSESGRTRLNTIEYGFIISKFKKTCIYPNYITAPSQNHLEKLPNGTQ